MSSKWTVLKKLIDIEELTVLNSSLMEKGNFYELLYIINHENYFGQQIFHLKYDMSQVEFETSLMFYSFDLEKDMCSCFYVGNPCVDVKLVSFQQKKSCIYLRESLFQQEKFDTSVFPLPIEGIEEMDIWAFQHICLSMEGMKVVGYKI